MNATQRYLARVSAAYDNASDYRISQLLDTSRQRVSHWRTGANQLDNAAAFRIAALLKIDAREIIAAVELERAKSEKDKAFWQRASTVAASILLAGLTGLQPTPTNASQRSAASDRNIHYAVRRRFGACPA